MASRWASMTRTLFGSPPFDSAITFQSDRFGSSMSFTSTVRTGPEPGVYCPSNWVPTAYGVNRTGMVSLPERAPEKRLVRPGLPSLNMTAAEAPAASAFATFCANEHVPRWMRAMLPGTNPEKSAAWQPLAELGVGVAGTTMPPAGWTVAVVDPATFPGLKSVPTLKDCGVG